jgi:DNA repair exonuclease SbcCD nuclease subunit
MKIAVISDTHFGVRNDSPLFLEYSFKFFEEIFFPYLKEHGITTVIHMGDLLDRRKYVNFNTLSLVKKRFFTPLEEMGVEVHCITGNHDTYWKNTNNLNSLRELFHNHIHLYETPTTVDFDGCSVLFLPWVNRENSEECEEALDSSVAPVLVGHLELDGYEVMRGINHNGGMSDNILHKFDLVMSGHFHCRQYRGNVHYLGTQYDLNFSDVNERKGFHVFDTKTLGLEFVENPHKMYHKLFYNDTESNYSGLDLARYKDSYLRIVVTGKRDEIAFGSLCEGLIAAGVANLSIVEEHAEEEFGEERIDMSKGTVELINETIDGMEITIDKEKLKTVIRDLYTDSLSL